MGGSDLWSFGKRRLTALQKRRARPGVDLMEEGYGAQAYVPNGPLARRWPRRPVSTPGTVNVPLVSRNRGAAEDFG